MKGKALLHVISVIVVLWVLWSLFRKAQASGLTQPGQLLNPFKPITSPTPQDTGVPGSFIPTVYGTGIPALDNTIGTFTDALSKNPSDTGKYTSIDNTSLTPTGTTADTLMSGGPGNPAFDTEANLLNFSASQNPAAPLFLMNNGIIGET